MRLELLVSMESQGLQEDLVSLVQKVLKGLEDEEDRRVIEVKWVSLEERVNRVKGRGWAQRTTWNVWS